MKNKFYAIGPKDDNFESPIYCFGEKKARQTALLLRSRFEPAWHMAEVTITRDGSFTYSEVVEL